MSKINLLVVNQFASTPRYSSGAGERFYYLAPFFKQEGINTRVVSGGYNHLFVENPDTPKLFNNEQVEGGLFTWVKMREYNKASFIGRFLSWIEFFLKLFLLKHKDRPDIVLVSSMSLFPIIYAFWLRLRFRSKVILEVRDIWPLTPIEIGGYGSRNPFILLMLVLEKWAYRGADVLVSVLPDFSKHLQNVLGPEKQAHWIPNAISESMTTTSPSRNNNILDKFVVIYTGSFGIANAMNIVIETANQLQDHKDILFRLVGDGPEKENLVRRSKLYKLNNIEFIGKVPKDKIQLYLNEANVAFISWRDSNLYDFGVSANKYNDYMISEIPIISLSNIKSDPVSLANCGYQIPSGDVVKFVEKIIHLKNLTQYERDVLGSRGRKYVMENHTYNIISSKYITIIKRLLCP